MHCKICAKYHKAPRAWGGVKGRNERGSEEPSKYFHLPGTSREVVKEKLN